MNPKEMRHLLLQYTNAAATDRELLFYLFDCKSRHTVMRSLATKIRKDPNAFRAYADLIADDIFKSHITEAAKHPDSKVAKEVLKTVLPVLTFAGRNTMVANMLGDTSSLAQAMAMSKRYGPITAMLTGTPDDINNPTSLRLACKSFKNVSFPAVAVDEFYKTLQENGTFVRENDIRIPLTYTQRAQKAAQNPVAVAKEFQTLAENVTQILLGCPLDFQASINSY